MAFSQCFTYAVTRLSALGATAAKGVFHQPTFMIGLTRNRFSAPEANGPG